VITNCERSVERVHRHNVSAKLVLSASAPKGINKSAAARLERTRMVLNPQEG
jgi:hypothetical protein